MEPTAISEPPAPLAEASREAPRTGTVTIPGGRARVGGEVRVAVDARPGEELVCQALAGPDGPLVRIAYARGQVLRGPVTASPGELSDLVLAVATHPAFGSARAALGLPEPAAGAAPAG